MKRVTIFECPECGSRPINAESCSCEPELELVTILVEDNL